jgi:hypothetical protein
MYYLPFETPEQLRQMLRDSTPEQVQGVNCNTGQINVFTCKHVKEKVLKLQTAALLMVAQKSE